ncbi:MAG TPA: helix-turn-helix domain-containing protein [Micromonosporaceae bacterium]
MKTRRIGPTGETNETPQHRALGTESRAAILRLVRSSDSGLTAADVVDHVGLHPSTVRAHLEQLVDAGLLVKARASQGRPGRPAWRYRAAVLEPAPGPYRTLAAALLEHLAAEGGTRAAEQAGQAWGRRLAGSMRAGDPIDAAMEALRDLGFNPQRQHPPAESADHEIHLRTCPFLDLVGPQPDTMCALHTGMVRGLMQASGAPRARAVLEPFAAPNACVVRLHLSRTRRSTR